MLRFALQCLTLARLFFLSAAGLAALALAPGDQIKDWNGGNGWINSAPLTPASLQGKVVLVDFWEYTCLNCLRTLPYLREWYKRYQDDGFVIVGVQTPEFEFSGDTKNVEDATKRLGITWPVVLDANYAIWKRYETRAWPTELLFDQTGKLVEVQVGEGNYPQTEAKIQSLLRQSNPHLTLPAPMALLPQDSYDKPGAVCYPSTAEMLIGRTPIADPAMGDPMTDLNYVDSSKHDDGKIYLQGYWHSTKEGLVYGGGDGYMALPYHAIQVEVVMRPLNGASRVSVTQDGKPIPHSDAGSDVQYDASGNSYVMVDQPRAYEVVMNAAFGHHELRLSPDHLGIGIYDFAFESCEIPGSK
jgi:thiol-disulfide isomerase/thioredoxin